MEATAWCEVSLFVDGEMAEAVAEVLARFAPGGVAIESTAVVAEPEGEGYPTGLLRVCAYLPVDPALEQTRARLEEALWYLGRIRPLPDPQFRIVQETDWAEAWKQHYHPIPIGKQLLIVPAWLEPDDPSRIPIRMDPGMAFGTGTHPTTQLCLEAIEAVVRQRRESGLSSIIDIGCGSGILAIAALRLGVQCALGVDTDSLAVKVARENKALNGVAGRMEVELGSVAEVRAGRFFIRQAPLVVANILAAVIIRLFAEGLGDIVAPGGVLILAGILDAQAAEVEAIARAHHFQVSEKLQQADWVALLLNPSDPTSSLPV